MSESTQARKPPPPLIVGEIRHRADSAAGRADQLVNVWHYDVRIDERNTAALHLRSDIWVGMGVRMSCTGAVLHDLR